MQNDKSEVVMEVNGKTKNHFEMPHRKLESERQLKAIIQQIEAL